MSSSKRRLNLTWKIENLYKIPYPSLLCTFNKLHLSEMKNQCQNYITMWLEFELKWTSLELKWTGTKNTSKMLSAKNYQHHLSINQTLKDKDTEMLQRKHFTFFTCCIGLDICLIKRSWVVFQFYPWILVLCEECLCLSCGRLLFPLWANQLHCSILQYTDINSITWNITFTMFLLPAPHQMQGYNLLF